MVETFTVEIIEKELVDIEVTEKELIGIELSVIDVIDTHQLRIETPINVNPLPSARFKTTFPFQTDKLLVFLNGMKIHTSEITIHSSTEFSFPIDIVTSDKVECSYIKQ